MGKKRSQEAEQDAYAQLAGGIGGLAVAFGCMAALKDALGLSWPGTIAVVAGVLTLLGYLAYRARRLWQQRGQLGAKPAVGGQQTAAAAALAHDPAPVEQVPVHPELTSALVKAGAIGRDQVIRADEVTITPKRNATEYDFLVPAGRTYADVDKKLANIAGMFGVTRLHLKLERSRDTERRARLLVLDAPPFTSAFPVPTRQQIAAHGGVPFGHDVTGELVGVETFSKASLLIAGMTQMGKTTLVNGLITCLLIAYEDFDLYLLDGKHCGLTKFEKVSLRYEASDDPSVMEEILDLLNDRVARRYKRMQEAVRNREPAPKFKPVFFIVDEAADFFANNGTPEGIKQALRIADKARALVAKALESEITTVMLTQRPAQNAIPVMVRDQFLYRMCLYVASEGTAKVALGDTYFETVAPISPVLLNSQIKGQGVLFAHGESTLIRGFHFPDEFIWEVVDAVRDRQKKAAEMAPDSPLTKAIKHLKDTGADFMLSAALADHMGIPEGDAAERGKALSKLLGVTAGRGTKGVRGYRLEDLTAAAASEQ
ncbi:FtsK/SpoIIIE domain-containing protein [Streptomyces sp. t39]|uniref:FtsK/SpoIIIE domain-containing protein n=1 Tax=Streptomyces sp. t39 TaxID=1828156 RepID=UPI0011CE071D|nr:FtsK/SpoIIIE domain-containing protein [Streptomyces sp. t39]TXS34846.1 hypothetical protein EAO77_38425 [Streptomyces sp. t39]